MHDGRNSQRGLLLLTMETGLCTALHQEICNSLPSLSSSILKLNCKNHIGSSLVYDIILLTISKILEVRRFLALL